MHPLVQCEIYDITDTRKNEIISILMDELGLLGIIEYMYKKNRVRQL